MRERATTAAAASAAGLALLLAAPTPAAALAGLQAPPPGAPETPLVALLSLLGWLLVGWLAVAVVLTAGGHLPGRAGRAVGAAARAAAPAALRRAVELSLGLTVVVGASAAPAVAVPADSPTAPPPAAVPELDWGTAPVEQSVEQPAAPQAPARAAPARPAHAAVVVRPGDTLWALAAQELGDGTAAVTDRDVAQRWPAWWQANRDVIGPDPDLLVPGQRLAPPS